jgi:hypothetical protein
MSQSNYNEAMVAELVELTEANAGVFTYAMALAFAEANGLKHRSVIAKVKSLGLAYEPKPVKVTKQGEPVVRKAELVAAVEAALGVAVPSLEKATKSDLQVLANALQR